MDHKNYFCYRLARALEKNEWHQFVREIKSGARTRHKGIKALVAVLSNHYPDFEIPDHEIIERFKRVLPLTIPQLRVLRSKMKQLLEQFIVEGSLQVRKNLDEELLVRGLIDRGAVDLAKTTLKKAYSKLTEVHIGLDSIEHRYQLGYIHLDLYTRDRQRKSSFDWHQLLDNLDAFALARKLSFLCAMLSERAFLSEIQSKEMDAVEEGLRAAEVYGPERTPVLNIYYQLLSLICGRDPQFHSDSLKKAMKAHGSKIERIERINVFGLQINYFLAASRHGKTGALREVFSLYQQMVAENLIFGMGVFSINSARNILSIGVRLGELDWTQGFLETAKGKLPDEESEKFYRYGVANLHFAAGKYGEAKKMLALAVSKDPFYKLAHDNLLLRICYEEGDTDLFYTVYAALNRHLYRKEGISKNYRASLQNLLKLIEPMFEIRWGQVNPERLTQLLEFADSCNMLANRDWVEKHLNSLESKLDS